MSEEIWAGHADCIQESRTPLGDLAWHVTCYDLVKALLNDDRLGLSHPDPARAARMMDSPMSGPLPATADAEDALNRERRKLMSLIFSPRRVASMRPKVEAIVNELLDGLQSAHQPANFHDLVSVPLPIAVMSTLLGIPPDDRTSLIDLVTRTTAVADPGDATAAILGLHRHMRGLLHQRKHLPSDDLLTMLVSMEAEVPIRYPGQSMEELVSLILIAGTAAVTGVIDHGLVLFLLHPHQQEALRGSRESAVTAIEEVVRFPSFSPPRRSAQAGGIMRYANTTFQIADVVVREGELVLLNNGRASLDGGRFPEPFRFDCGRSPNKHLGFGHGPHACPGANLARMELELLFRTLFFRMPSVQLDIDVGQLIQDGQKSNLALESLPIRWEVWQPAG